MGHAGTSFITWVFKRTDGSSFAITPRGTVRCSDDFLACLTLARAGAGLAQSYHFLVQDDLARGTLVEVLRSLAGRSWPFTLLQPPRRTPKLAVRLLVEALLEDARSRSAGRKAR